MKNSLKKGKKGGKRQQRIAPGQEVVIQPEQPAQPPQPLQPGDIPPKPLRKGKGKKKGGKVRALKLGKLRKAIKSSGAVLSPMQRKMRLNQQKRRAKEGFSVFFRKIFHSFDQCVETLKRWQQAVIGKHQ